MKRKKIYVGIIAENMEVFSSLIEPTKANYPWYNVVIGPFRTVRAAKWCVDHPHAQCTTVKEFERAALLHATQSELCTAHAKYLTNSSKVK